MGKVKIDNFFCLHRYIWNLFLQKFLLSSPLRFIWLLSKSLNLIGCQKRVHFRQEGLNIFFSKTIRWMKLLLFINAYGIILYINCVLFRSVKNPCCNGNCFHCCGYTWPIVR